MQICESIFAAPHMSLLAQSGHANRGDEATLTALPLRASPVPFHSVTEIASIASVPSLVGPGHISMQILVL